VNGDGLSWRISSQHLVCEWLGSRGCEERVPDATTRGNEDAEGVLSDEHGECGLESKANGDDECDRGSELDRSIVENLWSAKEMIVRVMLLLVVLSMAVFVLISVPTCCL